MNVATMNVAMAPPMQAARWLVLLLSCATSIAAAASADPAMTPALPAAVIQDAPDLQARGSGSFRWFGLHIYDATLWTPQSASAPGTPPDWLRPLALHLRYARSLRGADIAQRSIDEIQALGMGTPAQQRAWLQSMRELFPDVTNGSTLTGLHDPVRGARFFHDGRPLGAIAGAEFSRAFFSILLHPRSSAPALRETLLGPVR